MNRNIAKELKLSKSKDHKVKDDFKVKNNIFLSTTIIFIALIAYKTLVNTLFP